MNNFDHGVYDCEPAHPDLMLWHRSSQRFHPGHLRVFQSNDNYLEQAFWFFESAIIGNHFHNKTLDFIALVNWMAITIIEVEYSMMSTPAGLAQAL